MVAVRSHLSSLPLDAAVEQGHPDVALRAAARALADGEEPAALVDSLLGVALRVCGREAAGASWSHALLSLGAVVGLDRAWGRDVVIPAVVGAAGFLAFARPTRARRIPDGADPWEGTPRWLDRIRAGDLDGAVRTFRAVPFGDRDEAWRRASLLTAAGWGHQAIVGGHFLRLGRAFPHREHALREAAIRAWVPVESQPEPIAPVGGVSDAPILAITESPGRARAQAPLGKAGLEAAAVAALELLRRTPGLRAVHGVTYTREALQFATEGEVRPEEVARVLEFVAGGWERARRDRRLRGERATMTRRDLDEAHDEDPVAAWEETIGELCRTELRPGFGHNVKIAESCSWLARALPDRDTPRVLAALRATVPAWTRSRRPALAWREASAESQPPVGV